MAPLYTKDCRLRCSEPVGYEVDKAVVGRHESGDGRRGRERKVDARRAGRDRRGGHAGRVERRLKPALLLGDAQRDVATGHADRQAARLRGAGSDSGGRVAGAPAPRRRRWRTSGWECRAGIRRARRQLRGRTAGRAAGSAACAGIRHRSRAGAAAARAGCCCLCSQRAAGGRVWRWARTTRNPPSLVAFSTALVIASCADTLAPVASCCSCSNRRVLSPPFVCSCQSAVPSVPDAVAAACHAQASATHSSAAAAIVRIGARTHPKPALCGLPELLHGYSSRSNGLRASLGLSWLGPRLKSALKTSCPMSTQQPMLGEVHLRANCPQLLPNS